jgi:hypothetical protein
MKTKYCWLLVFLLPLVSCVDESKNIDSEKLYEKASKLNYAIDSYYLNNGFLPKKEEDFINDIRKDTLNNSKDENLLEDNEIRYVPIFRGNEYPEEYFLIATSKGKVDESDNRKINKIVKASKGICDPERRPDDDILLSNRNPFLITKENITYDLGRANSNYLKQRLYYNVSFTIDTSAVISKNLSYSFTADSTEIKGRFYNEAVKERVLKKLENAETVNLIGLKTEILANGIFLKNTYVKSPSDSIPKGQYYDETGNPKKYLSLTDCY